MAERHVFPSLARSNEWAYTLHSDGLALLDSRSACLAYWAGQFQTYGDGMTQHSPECLVPYDPRIMADYLGSLAQTIVAPETPPSQRDTMLATLASVWPRSYKAHESTRFLVSVTYKEGKKRYYSLREDKVSSADSKRYDKRWEEIPEWADGSPRAVYRFLVPEYNSEFVEQFSLAETVLDVYGTITGQNGFSASYVLQLEWDADDRYAFMHFRSAFRACEALAQSHIRFDDAERSLSCYLHNTKAQV